MEDNEIRYIKVYEIEGLTVKVESNNPSEMAKKEFNRIVNGVSNERKQLCGRTREPLG